MFTNFINGATHQNMEVVVKKKSMTKLANALTIARVLLTPFIIYLIFQNQVIPALAVFIVASLTDFLDGFIARAFNAGSKFGAMLDPISDKLLVISVLVALSSLAQSYCSINVNGVSKILINQRADFIPVVIILCREILVSGLREFLAFEKIEMPVTKLAKWKTTFQFIAIIAILAAPLSAEYSCRMHQIGQITLWVAALLTAITGYQYFKHTLKNMPK